MALPATLHHLQLELSDTDRGVYASLDLRASRHPSESARYLVTRVLALCLLHEEGIAFSRGLSTTEEPAVWVREPDGRVLLWIDIGRPSAERLHKASKNAARVVVCTTDPADVLRRATEGERIHRAAELEIVTLPKEVVEALEPLLERNLRWDVVHSGGTLYVTASGVTYGGAVSRAFLAE